MWSSLNGRWSSQIWKNIKDNSHSIAINTWSLCNIHHEIKDMSIYLFPCFSSFHTEDNPRGCKMETPRNIVREKERESIKRICSTGFFMASTSHQISDLPDHNKPAWAPSSGLYLNFFFFLWTKEVSLLHFLKSILGLWAKQLEVASLSWCKWDSILGPMKNKKRLY